MFSIEFSNQAKKFLKKVDKPVALRLVKRIEKLAIDPFPTDVKRVVNYQDKIFRIRVGNYRIEYCVIYERNMIFITEIEKRERAYQ